MKQTAPTASKDIFLSVMRTNNERDSACTQIDMFVASLYKEQNGSFSTRLSYSFSEELAKAINTVFAAERMDETDAMHLQTFFSSLKEFLGSLPSLHLTLAFTPSRQMLYTFLSWARTNLDPQVIIATVVDESLIAGAIMEYNGRYIEHSYSDLLEKAMVKNKAQLLSQLT